MAHVKYTEEGTPYISNDWHIADVESVCEQMEVTLTEDEMEDVLHDVANSFDANYGIAWDNFEMAIQDVIRSRREDSVDV
jgi:hypothetical protein